MAASHFVRIVIRGLDFFRDVASPSSSLDVYSLHRYGEALTARRKAFRAVRMVRTFRLFKGLQLLVKACTCFLPSLGWSMVLLVVFMSIGTLVLGNLLQDFITNESNNLEARPVLEKVSQGFVVFFVLSLGSRVGGYVTIIVFAIIRVISAIFLKDTLDAAQADAESVVVDRLRKKAEYLQKLESLFRAMDEEGDGMISEQKLLSIFANPKVEAYFQTLDVDVTEGAALFNMIDNGDGQVTLDEFVDGILRCRGPAPGPVTRKLAHTPV
ncbi:Two pore calcium channel protein 1B [Durusdinium trenchii]|uniref:Two pore calcium channel protein 1B n=1 Tax=Durusdinium trenchii TaxID=1381693 RepID=A0ABP0QTQ1_9DINO